MYDEDVDDFLAHYGVKGMKWGVRKDRPGGVSARVNRDAKKDAREFARAKMFYGEGAGTRRKLIKATVDQKTKNNPAYREAFDHHLANQDMSKHAAKAQSERRRKNVTATTSKTARGVHRQLTGGFGNVSMASAVIAAAYVGARKTGVDQTIKKAALRTVSDLARSRTNTSSSANAEDWLRNQGWL